MIANTLNPDADVAAHNLRRNDELATRYLYLLSDDAVPALVAGLDTTTGQVNYDLPYELSYRLAGMQQDTQWQDWQSFHFSRWNAYNALLDAATKGKLDTYPVHWSNRHWPQ